MFTFKKFTCKLSHPLKMPSSIPLIMFPDRSRIRKLVNVRNSGVENIGLRESPRKLSPNRRSSKIF